MTIASRGLGQLLDVRDFGVVGDGTTDDSDAIERAWNIAAARGGGNTLYFPKGTFKITRTLALSQSDTTIRGEGYQKTTLKYTPTSGALITLGSFDGNVSNYASTGSTQNITVENIRLQGTYDAAAASPTGTPHGIVDYESGGFIFRNVRFDQLYRGFWGVSSDLNHFEDTVFTRCEIGAQLENRCDQQAFTNVYAFGCGTVLLLRNVTNVRISRGAFVDNIGTDVVLAGNAASVVDPLNGANIYSSGIQPKATTVVTLEDCWFENYHNKNNGGAWDRGQPLKDCFVSIGITDTSNNRPVRAVKILNATVGCPTGTQNVRALAQIGYAEKVEIDGVNFDDSEDVAVVETTQNGYVDSGGAIYFAGEVTVDRVYRKKNYGTGFDKAILADKISPLSHRPSFGLRTSILGNPTFAKGQYGWATSNASAATYTPTTDTCLGGNPITITASSSFGYYYHPLRRLRGTTAYEVVIRYKTSVSTMTNRWQLAIADSGTAPDNRWIRNLAPSTEWVETRFLVPNFGTTFTTPRILIRYLGTTFTETITVDYVDVQEITPVGTGITNGRVEFWGSAAPTSGTWEVGDIVKNVAPASGGFVGWVCVAAGTPGTWTTWGAIT